MNKCTIAILISNSVFCAAGVILILISCIQFGLWWPLLTIGVHALAVLFPVMCGGCQVDHDVYSEPIAVNCALLSWLFVGIFTTAGYAIPSILYRGGKMPEVGLILTLAGGTVILSSILVFVRAVYFAKDDNKAYAF